MLSANVDEVMDRIRSRFDVEVTPLKIGSKTLKVLQFKDFDQYIERFIESESVDMLSLPYWAKIWPSSLVLAYFLGKQPVKPGQRFLEIGAGLGVTGLYAALCGHRVTLTDINEDALLFAQANVLLNGCPGAEVRRLDWTDREPFRPYDVILGSEVLYDTRRYALLVEFLRRALAPHGTIFLAKNSQISGTGFFSELTKHFKFKQTVQTIRSDEEVHRIGLYAIRFKEEPTVH